MLCDRDRKTIDASGSMFVYLQLVWKVRDRVRECFSFSFSIILQYIWTHMVVVSGCLQFFLFDHFYMTFVYFFPFENG